MAAATPEVPSEMLTSPTPMLRPSDAMALSPPPGASRQPPSTVTAVFVGGRIEVRGAGGVGTVGEQRIQVRLHLLGGRVLAQRAVAGDAPAQPVVRQADRGDACGVLRFVRGDHLGDRQRGDQRGTDGLDPALAAAHRRIVGQVVLAAVGGLLGLAQTGDEHVGVRGGTGVVPQQCVTDHAAMVVEQYHAVLLAADGQRGYVVQAETDHLAGLGVGDAHLGRLGGRVHAGHQNSAHCASLQHAAKNVGLMAFG